ncbi:MAG: hypothetical protein ACOC9Q_03405 [bacterium]
MTVSASDIHLGRCYVTGYREVRRVVDLDVSEVTYETIGAGSIVSVSREKFAAEVDREVGCPD